MVTHLVETSGSYELTRFNALTHGVLSRHLVLPWEDRAEYQALLATLVAEHQPTGPTEAHLVEELAGVIWRKQRLRRAEAAAHRSRLKLSLSAYQGTADAAVAHLGRSGEGEDVREAVAASGDATVSIAEVDAIRSAADRAIELLEADGASAYAAALALLPGETQEWWAEQTDATAPAATAKEECYQPTPSSLLRFLQTEVIPWLTEHRLQLEHQPLFREQALGEAADPPSLERLHRYEVHLDRKLERMLAMLYKLKELRRSTSEAE